MHKVYMFFRQLARDIILRVGSIGKKPSNGIHIITAHMSHRIKPDIKYFEATMAKLSKQVRFIRIEDAVRMIEAKEVVNEPLVAFTFDDGLAECYETIVPVLEKYNTNAIFFVNPNFVEGDDAYIKNFTENIIITPGKKPMRWEQLINLQKRAHIIGAHTMDHYLTAQDDPDELRHQILDCKKVLEDRLGVSCDYFAWPFGRLEHTSSEAVKLACDNFKYVFSQSNYRHYFSFDGSVINRRHFEPFWPYSHIKYFLSKEIQY